MEIRKIKIGPEDETRLRELLKIHEADIDSLSDEELDAAEQQTSQRLQTLLKNKHNSHIHNASILRFRFPLKTGTMAFLAAAAVMLFVQMQGQESGSDLANMVIKGNGTATEISCDVMVVDADNTTPDYKDGQYQVPSGKSIHLKMRCQQSVFAHVGIVENGTLHLELSNVEIAREDVVFMQDSQPKDFRDLAAKTNGLMVLVTQEPLKKTDLSEAERTGLWSDEVPLSIQP